MTSTRAHKSPPSSFQRWRAPLDSRQIRLVQLQPAHRKIEVIRCSTIVVPFEKATVVPYESLSYAWGDDRDRRLILVDGTEHEVTKNLYDALRRLRRSEQSRALWVDQISINQSDDVEKSGQVTMMPYIFSAADRVLAWLGDGDYAELFALLNDRERMVAVLNALRINGNSISLRTGYGAEEDCTRIDIENHNCLLGLISLIHSPWFARVWILQEIARAKSIQLLSGPDSAGWQDFAGLLQNVKLYCSYDTILQRPMDVASNVAWLRTAYRLMNPSDIILAGRYSRSSTPVDQIYALLAMVHQNGPSDNAKSRLLPIDVDYALPVAEVYREATRQAIKSDHQIAVLTLLARGTPMTGLPSWVPDYSLVTSTVALSHFIDQRRYALNTDRFEASIQDGSDGNILVLQGVQIGTLHAVSGVLDIEFDEEKYNTYQRWLTHARKLTYRWHESEFITALRETLIPGEYIFWSEHHPSTAIDEAFKHWMEHVDSKTLPARGSIAERVSIYIEQCCTGRKFATTQRGEFCLVPEESTRDDVVLLLGGGKLPFVARPNGPSYRLIGECFVHGKNLNAIMEYDKHWAFRFV